MIKPNSANKFCISDDVLVKARLDYVIERYDNARVILGYDTTTPSSHVVSLSDIDGHVKGVSTYSWDQIVLVRAKIVGFEHHIGSTNPIETEVHIQVGDYDRYVLLQELIRIPGV